MATDILADFWVIGWALVGSVCLFANGGIHYIDALFLGSGAATQSGLNTIDINLLTTWQQIVLFFVPIFTNPITINSLVVLFRLVLFEKRFKKIAADKKKNRRSLAKTFSHSKTSLDQNIDREEMGVRGRSIVVMHDTTVPNGMTTERSRAEEFAHHMEKINAIEEEPARSSNDSGRTERQPSDKASRSKSPGAADRPSAGIKFADQLKPGANGVVFGDLNSGDVEEEERRPSHRTPEEHIAILERQRKQDDGAVLRIPGPRDADAGVAPQAVEDSDVLSRTMSRRASTHQSGGADVDAGALNGDDHPTHDIEAAKRRNITITEPQKEPVGERATKDTASAKHSMGGLRFRKNRLSRHTTEKDDDGSMTEPVTRTGTLQRIRTALTTSKDEGAPYLSWEPTVGRNSLFFDLTEDQREELGGIEYRSLKSLAAILAVYFVGFSLVGLVSLLPWILKSPTYGSIVTNVGQGKAWWAIFTANSAFTDLGFTLTPDSMISFQTAVWPLLIMSFLIIIGNTGFPIMLRFMIWVLSKIVPEGSGIWEELKFLLDHPRRCFTLLFPSGATWILFLILCGLNGLDLLFFIILDVRCLPFVIECY
jgi:potassium uptake Trk family protein